ncbi:MAG: NADH-quinone oxidoreductase subunit C [Verrucomicrobiota bacterium]|nr:NADH-quinone oxidoreductase subunit C [Verrucomicrobiota bacterium]
MKIIETLMTQLTQLRDGECATQNAEQKDATAPLSVNWKTTDYAICGYHFDISVPADKVVEAAKMMDAQGFTLDAITGVDWMAKGEFEVVYDFFHFLSLMRVVVRTRIPRAQPDIATISTVYPGANWHERETHDFFGIRFTGHPNLIPILLPEDATFHPLLKDFQA